MPKVDQRDEYRWLLAIPNNAMHIGDIPECVRFVRVC